MDRSIQKQGNPSQSGLKTEFGVSPGDPIPLRDLNTKFGDLPDLSSGVVTESDSAWLDDWSPRFGQRGSVIDAETGRLSREFVEGVTRFYTDAFRSVELDHGLDPERFNQSAQAVMSLIMRELKVQAGLVSLKRQFPEEGSTEMKLLQLCSAESAAHFHSYLETMVKCCTDHCTGGLKKFHLMLTSINRIYQDYRQEISELEKKGRLADEDAPARRSYNTLKSMYFAVKPDAVTVSGVVELAGDAAEKAHGWINNYLHFSQKVIRACLCGVEANMDRVQAMQASFESLKDLHRSDLPVLENRLRQAGVSEDSIGRFGRRFGLVEKIAAKIDHSREMLIASILHPGL